MVILVGNVLKESNSYYIYYFTLLGYAIFYDVSERFFFCWVVTFTHIFLLLTEQIRPTQYEKFIIKSYLP